MSNAWQTTVDDVMGAMEQNGTPVEWDEAEQLINELDHGKIERAALSGDDMDEQTDYAYAEICRQLGGL